MFSRLNNVDHCGMRNPRAIISTDTVVPVIKSQQDATGARAFAGKIRATRDGVLITRDSVVGGRKLFRICISKPDKRMNSDYISLRRAG